MNMIIVKKKRESVDFGGIFLICEKLEGLIDVIWSPEGHIKNCSSPDLAPGRQFDTCGVKLS